MDEGVGEDDAEGDADGGAIWGDGLTAGAIVPVAGDSAAARFGPPRRTMAACACRAVAAGGSCAASASTTPQLE